MEEKENETPANGVSELSDAIRLTLFPFGENGTIILLPGKFPYFRFTSFRIRNAVGLLGRDWEKNLFDLIAFEIVNDEKSRTVNLNLYVGPGEEKKRQEWIHYAYKHGLPFVLGKSLFQNGKRWQSLYSEILLGKNDYDGATPAAVEKLTRSINEFVKKRLPYFEKALMDKK
jgi:hypothetical protein